MLTSTMPLDVCGMEWSSMAWQGVAPSLYRHRLAKSLGTDFRTGIPKPRLKVTTTKTLICPGWETAVVPVSQPGTPVRDKRGCPFIPGLATGTKSTILSRLVTPIRTKGAASATCLAHPFVLVGPFFFCSSFLDCFSISIILLHFN